MFSFQSLQASTRTDIKEDIVKECRKATGWRFATTGAAREQDILKPSRAKENETQALFLRVNVMSL